MNLEGQMNIFELISEEKTKSPTKKSNVKPKDMSNAIPLAVKTTEWLKQKRTN